MECGLESYAQAGKLSNVYQIGNETQKSNFETYCTLNVLCFLSPSKNSSTK